MSDSNSKVPTTNHKVGAGRGNKAEFDDDLIFDLAKHGCTYEEIAEITKCNKATLVRNKRDLIAEGHSIMKKSLRRKQLEVALNDGNATMLIWLGKQELGQKDTHQMEHTGKDGEELVFNFNIGEPPLIAVTPVKILTDQSEDDNNGEN